MPITLDLRLGTAWADPAFWADRQNELGIDPHRNFRAEVESQCAGEGHPIVLQGEAAAAKPVPPWTAQLAAIFTRSGGVALADRFVRMLVLLGG